MGSYGYLEGGSHFLLKQLGGISKVFCKAEDSEGEGVIKKNALFSLSFLLSGRTVF